MEFSLHECSEVKAQHVCGERGGRKITIFFSKELYPHFAPNAYPLGMQLQAPEAADTFSKG